LTRTRRQVLGALAAVGAATLVDPGSVLAQLAADQPCADPGTAGTLLGTLPLSRAGAPVQPFGVKFGGRGLDTRLVTDLSLIQPDRLLTPTARAFIRTERPTPFRARSTMTATGLVRREGTLSIDDWRRDATPMGAHLIECSGNDNPANFGLMSVAEWDGVPLADVVSRLQPDGRATGVLVSGVDPGTAASSISISGASWVYPLASLDRLGAFFAVRMNGEPLAPDHGAPVRLVVPGWYGCTWIKWVQALRLVGPDEPATGQMKEFAGRTHQTARHDLASAYTPADIQVAATPVRVEKRRGPNGLDYRIVGIVWGGQAAIDRLAIRFGPDEAWTPFSICPVPKTHTTWSLWEYRWRPKVAGLYSITLRVPDASVPQRRLDTGYYMRQVRIEEV
jgi:DMSO/TMAO reductase YedYZ molybdopterin-dependent catalytic subunit